MMIGVSVILCCYNSAKRLPLTLKHLAEQNVDSNIAWEVLIVDNASTDHTVALVNDLVSEYEFKCPVRIVQEKKAGLTFARKKGIEDCKYEYIIFCDDDNWLSSNFVSEAFKILSENIKCGIAGGRLLPQFETEKPRWFDSYQLFYTVGEKPVDPGDVTDRCVIPGAGMITRKSIWLKVFDSNYKFLCVDRMGNSLSTGGDMEMCEIVRNLKYRIHYSDVIHLKHFIPKERLTLEYLKRNAFGFGIFNMLIQPYYYLSAKNINRWIWFKDFAYNILQIRKPFINLLYLKRFDFVVNFNLQIGKVYGLLSLRKQYLSNIAYIKRYYETLE